jgi:hypothetical protein
VCTRIKKANDRRSEREREGERGGERIEERDWFGMLMRMKMEKRNMYVHQPVMRIVRCNKDRGREREREEE